MEIGNLYKKKFRVMIINMITEFKRRMEAQSEKLEVLNKS